MKNALKISMAILSILSFASSCKNENKNAINFKLNLAKDNNFVYSVDMKQNVTSEKQQLTNNILVDYGFSVIDVNDSVSKMYVLYKHLNMDITFGDKKVNLDTDDTTNVEAKPLRENLINKPFLVSLNSKGEVSNISGWDKILIGARNGNGMDEAAFKKTLELTFNIYPNKPVEVGDTWAKENVLNIQGFDMDVKTDYTFKELKGDLALLDLKSIVKSTPKNDTNYQNKSLKASFEGTQNGKMWVNVKNGMIEKGELHQDVKMKTNIQDKEQLANMKSDINITCKKLK